MIIYNLCFTIWKIKNQKTLGENWVAPNAVVIGDVKLEKILVFGLMLL